MTEHKKVLKRWAVYDIISKKHDRENYRLKTVRKKLCLYEILQIQRVTYVIECHKEYELSQMQLKPYFTHC